MNTRKYKMDKRADLVGETRQRITEAAVRLHTTLGPASTTIAAIAEEAGVTRLTVYRHFADDATLFAACSRHWAEQNPPPDPHTWAAIEDFESRLPVAFGELYGYYAEKQDDMWTLLRDLPVWPESAKRALDDDLNAMTQVLMRGSPRRGRPRQRQQAIIRHLVSFPAWRSLAVEGELKEDETVDLAVGFIRSV